MRMLREIAEETHELEMTPMIDVTFLLLIFFLLTLKFRVLEGKLSAYLPKDAGPNAGTVEREDIEIEVRVVEGAEGTRVFAGGPDRGAAWDPLSERRFTFVAGTRALQYRVGPRRFADLAGLTQRLEALYAVDPKRRVTLDALRGTFTGDVVPVLDALVETGFESITFVGESAR